MYQLTSDPQFIVRASDNASIPVDPLNRDYREYLAWLDAGNTPTPADSPDVQAQVVADTQKRLDDFARTRNYDGILSACTYATSPTAKFASEGAYCVQARDATWAKLYAILDDVQAGLRPEPTGYADIEPELPALAWPA